MAIACEVGVRGFVVSINQSINQKLYWKDKTEPLIQHNIINIAQKIWMPKELSSGC